MLAGGKFRDRILCYCDTDSVPYGTARGKRLKARMEQGFGFLKMDVGIGLLRDVPGTLIAPPGMLDTVGLMHPFTGIQISEHGIEVLVDYVDQLRAEIGYEVPLAVDHFGHIGVPEKPGLGFDDINPDAFAAIADPVEPMSFDTPTSQWDHETSHNRLWS